MGWWWLVQTILDLHTYAQTTYVCICVLLACRAAARHIYRAASLARTNLAQVFNESASSVPTCLIRYLHATALNLPVPTLGGMCLTQSEGGPAEAFATLPEDVLLLIVQKLTLRDRCALCALEDELRLCVGCLADQSITLLPCLVP